MSELNLLKRLYNIPFLRSVFTILNNNNGDFGVREAILYARSIDFFTRYQSVLDFFSTSDKRVLEVGAGKLGVGTFVNFRELICLDVSREVIRTASGERIIASADKLPFQTNSIDIVLSVDCIEHLPKQVRDSFISEAKRVGYTVIVHTPVRELCLETDLKFARTHKRLFRQLDKVHYQHIQYKQPSLSELRKYFPDIFGFYNQNRNVNYILFVLQRIPLLGWLTGFYYLLFLKRLHKEPPYYGVTIRWDS